MVYLFERNGCFGVEYNHSHVFSHTIYDHNIRSDDFSIRYVHLTIVVPVDKAPKVCLNAPNVLEFSTNCLLNYFVIVNEVKGLFNVTFVLRYGEPLITTAFSEMTTEIGVFFPLYLPESGSKNTSASTIKKVSKSKKIISEIKLQEKKKQRNVTQIRDSKQQLVFFEPEGLFTVGLDVETQEFFSNLISRFAESFQIRIDFMGPIYEKLTFVLQKLRDISASLAKFVRGIILFFSSFFSSPVKNLIFSLLGEHVETEVVFDIEMEPEGGFSLEFLTPIFTKYFSDFIDLSNWFMFIDRVRILRSSVQSSKSVLSWLYSLLKEFMQLFCDSIGIVNPLDQDMHPDIVLVQKKAREYLDAWHNGRDTDYDFSRKVYELQTTIENMVHDKRRRYSPQMKEKLVYLLRKFSPIVDYCTRHVNPNNGPRVPTFGVLIGGPTSAGKSTLSQLVLHAIIANVLEGEELAEFMANHNDFIDIRHSELGFWDGTHPGKAFAIVYDDFGQLRDSVGNPNLDAFEIIRLINSAPYHLHFAALEDKQRHYAHYKMAYATTNLSKFQFDSLHNSEAVVRRFDVAYVQVPKAEFCIDGSIDIWSRRFDFAKLRKKYPEDDPNNFIVLDAVEFVPWDFLKGVQKPGKPLSFKEFIKECVLLYKKRHGAGQQLLEFQEKMKHYNPFEPEMGEINRVNSVEAVVYHDSESVLWPKDEIDKGKSVEKMRCLRSELGTILYPGTLTYLSLRDIAGPLYDMFYDEDQTDWKEFISDVSILNKVLARLPTSCHSMLSSMYAEVLSKWLRGKQSFISTAIKAFVSSTRFVTSVPGFYLAALKMLLVDACAAIASTSNKIYPNSPLFSNLNKHKYRWLTGVVKGLGAVAGVLISVKAGIHVAQSLAKAFAPSFTGESNTSRSEYKRQQGKLKKPLNVASAIKKVPEFGSDSIDPTVALQRRNLYILRCYNQKIGWALFVSGTTFVIPRHFEHGFYGLAHDNGDDQPQVEFVHPVTGHVAFVIKWDSSEICYYDRYSLEGDLVDFLFVKITTGLVRQHRSILNYFPKCNTLKQGENYNSHISLKRGTSIVLQSCLVNITGNSCYKQGDEEYWSRLLSYSVPTDKGDCGSPLVSTDPRLGRPTVLGIHTAGSPSSIFSAKRCCGVYISYEDVAEAISKLEGSEFFESIEVEQVEAEIGVNVLHKGKQPSMPTKTKLRISRLAPELGWVTDRAPARLCPFVDKETGVRINPAEIARANYQHDEPYVDPDVLEEVYHVVTNFVNRRLVPPPWEPRLFSFEEAVAGVPGYFDSLNRKSSAGYPYTLDGIKGKTKWFGDGDEFDFSSADCDELRSEVLAIIDDCKRNIRREHVFIDYLKDETRPIPKVKKGATRQFMACPLPLLIAFRMYFGDFVRSCGQNRIMNGSAIGIDPISEWTVLYLYLTNGERDRYMTAGDYSKFDTRIPVPIGMTAARIIEDYYYNASETDRQVRAVLFLEVINSIHISEGFVYDCYGGNPSGNFLTSTYNTICNILELSYVARVNSPSEKFSDVFSRVRIIAGGDDNLISYPKADNAIWGMVAMQAGMKRYLNQDYTPEDKSTDLVEGRTIDEVVFLRRRFRQCNGKVFAPLELDSIEKSLMWEKKDTTDADFRLRVEGALAELAQHGLSVFEEKKKDIVRSSQKILQYTPVNSTFKNALASDIFLSDA